MNIGLLTQYYKPEMGAPPNRLFEMISGLKECGNNVVVVTGMPNYPTGKIFQEYRGRFSLVEECDGIEIKRFWLYASNTKKIIPRIWNMLSFSITSFCALHYLRQKKLDYLIVESPPLLLALSGRWMAKILNVNYVANISDLWPLSAKELGAISDGKIYKILEKIERHIYRKADIVMGQSEEIVSHISACGGKNTYLFRNGVDPSRFNNPNLKKDRGTGPIKLVYAGLLGFAQGIADICRSINFHDLGAEFHIFGDGGEKCEIESILKETPNKGIFYHGVVPREELPKVLLNSDMTLIPLIKNIYGAVPSKIYESMAAGLPIIFMGEGEGAKIVQENNIGLVAHAKDYATLKENIKYAATHPDDISEMIENCIEAANKKFNRPKQIAALNEFLKSQLHD